MMQAMIEDLKDYSVDEIGIAFRKWRANNSKIPTPASILKLLGARKAEGRAAMKRFSDFDGDWLTYKQYLFDHGLISHEFKPPHED